MSSKDQEKNDGTEHSKSDETARSKHEAHPAHNGSATKGGSVKPIKGTIIPASVVQNQPIIGVTQAKDGQPVVQWVVPDSSTLGVGTVPANTSIVACLELVAGQMADATDWALLSGTGSQANAVAQMLPLLAPINHGGGPDSTGPVGDPSPKGMFAVDYVSMSSSSSQASFTLNGYARVAVPTISNLGFLVCVYGPYQLALPTSTSNCVAYTDSTLGTAVEFAASSMYLKPSTDSLPTSSSGAVTGVTLNLSVVPASTTNNALSTLPLIWVTSSTASGAPVPTPSSPRVAPSGANGAVVVWAYGQMSAFPTGTAVQLPSPATAMFIVPTS